MTSSALLFSPNFFFAKLLRLTTHCIALVLSWFICNFQLSFESMWTPRYNIEFDIWSSCPFNSSFGFEYFMFFVNNTEVIFVGLNSSLFRIDHWWRISRALLALTCNSAIVGLETSKSVSSAKPCTEVLFGSSKFNRESKIIPQNPGPHALPWGQPLVKCFWISVFWYQIFAVLPLKYDFARWYRFWGHLKFRRLSRIIGQNALSALG